MTLPQYVTSSKMDLYADDTAFTSSLNHCSLGKLQDNLNSSIAEVEEWTASNKLPINKEKTKAILVTGKRPLLRIDGEMSLTMNGSVIELVSIVKLLDWMQKSTMTFCSLHTKTISCIWYIEENKILFNHGKKAIIL